MNKRARKPRASRARRAGARREPSALALPSECTLADAETLKLRLTKLLKSETPVTLDASAVQRIDTASMQLLAAFARDRRSSRLKVKTVRESPVFHEAVRLLGLAEILARTAPTPAP